MEKINFLKEYTSIDNPGSLSGVNTFYKYLKSKYKNVKFKDVQEWLKSQDTYTLHRPRIKNFQRNRVYASGIDDNWQIDLCDMRALEKENKGVNYILTVIDVFSKFAFVRLLKNKKGPTVLEALKSILDERKPKRIQADEGNEFFNAQCKAYMDKHDINLYFINSELKASVVERFNRTLKEKIWKYFTLSNTQKYIDVLPQIVDTYNNTYHRSIKMTPNQVKKSNSQQVFINLYGFDKNLDSNINRLKANFKVGDAVRLSKYKSIFEKGYTRKWTNEIFIISKILYNEQIRYQVKDLNDETIMGNFYQNEIQKVYLNQIDKKEYKYNEDSYEVEILKTRKVKNKIEYFVHWKNYPKSSDSWIKAKDLI
jgi:hypothetical protein